MGARAAGTTTTTRQESPLERHLRLAMAAVGLPVAVQEHQFHPTRKWRLDFCWPAVKLAVEIEGGAFAGPGHRSVGVFLKNIDKYNALTLLGWRLLRFHGDQVRSGEAVETIRQALQGEAS